MTDGERKYFGYLSLRFPFHVMGCLRTCLVYAVKAPRPYTMQPVPLISSLLRRIPQRPPALQFLPSIFLLLLPLSFLFRRAISVIILSLRDTSQRLPPP